MIPKNLEVAPTLSPQIVEPVVPKVNALRAQPALVQNISVPTPVQNVSVASPVKIPRPQNVKINVGAINRGGGFKY
jgi:hypothetical protein